MKKESSRRTFLIRGAACLAGSGICAPIAMSRQTPTSSIRINLAAYGGVPGAASSTLIAAFAGAFAALKAHGGGTLVIPAGTYDLGSYDANAYAVDANGLNNVLISGYGAHLIITTTAIAMPVILRFFNCSNITVAGLHFSDPGTNLNVNWKGAVCIQSDCTVACSGIKVVDCEGTNVLTFFRATGGGKRNNYLLTNLDIQGSVTDAYYGVNVNYTGRFSKVRLRTNRVRRAFICYGAQNWDVALDGTVGGPGSNAYCELPTDEYGPVVSDLDIRITARGPLHWHKGLVTFFHQGPLSVAATMKNIKVDVALVEASSLPGNAIFWFTHLAQMPAMLATTSRTWKNIELTGSMDVVSAALFRGADKIVYCTTTSTAPGNSIRISSALLAGRQNTDALPRYFSVIASDQDRRINAVHK